MKKLFLFLTLLFVGLSVNAQLTPVNNLNYVKFLKVPPTGLPTDQTLVYDSVDQILKMRPAVNESREEVNDANKTITGTGNRLVAYTAITADRTVTLPPATTANQRIWITDESGLCSNARRIIVQPNGSDVIGGDAFSVINFPNGSGYLESNGSGKWNIISTTAVQFSSGVNTMPTITDNGNGSVTLGTGVYSMFANTNGTGRPKAYQIPGGTFAFVDGSTNYIYADYNTTTGAVTLQQTVNESPLNDLTQILIYAAYRQGTTLHPRNFDTQGIALSNKINRSIYRTQRVRFEEGGVLVGESASPAVRTITISSGTVWVGATEQALSALTSAVNTCYHVIQTSPGVWTTTTVVTQYNNTQYNTTAGLQTLNNNEYGVNWLYRSIGTDNDMAIILGGASYTLGQAQASQKPTNLPPFMRHMELVGRIIVLKNATTATQIDNVSSTFFTASGVTDHNALNNLQTAQTGVTYGHVTDAAQTFAGIKTFSSSPVVPTATTGLQAVNKNYVDSITSSGVSNVSTVTGVNVTNALDNLNIGKENAANKQNSLATDGTGVKFPTVDATNNGLVQNIKMDVLRQKAKSKTATNVSKNYALYGDSHTDGAFSSTWRTYLTPKWKAGFAYNEIGFVHIDDGGALDKGMSFGKTAGMLYMRNVADFSTDPVKYSPCGRGLYTDSGSGSDNFSLGSGSQLFTKVRIYYLQRPDGGSFSYRFSSSGSGTTVSMVGALSVQYVDLVKSAGDSNIVVVSSITGKAAFFGMWFYNGDRASSEVNLAIGGMSLTRSIGLDSTFQQYWFSVFKPAVFLFNIGTNDRVLGFTTPAAFEANMTTYLNNVALGSPDTQRIIVEPYQTSDYATTNAINFTQNRINVANSLGIQLVSLPENLGDYATFVANGWMNADGVHAVDKGNEVIARYFGELLSITNFGEYSPLAPDISLSTKADDNNVLHQSGNLNETKSGQLTLSGASTDISTLVINAKPTTPGISMSTFNGSSAKIFEAQNAGQSVYYTRWGYNIGGPGKTGISFGDGTISPSVLLYHDSFQTLKTNGNFIIGGNATLVGVPSTSAGSFDIVTRNQSTGVFEKVASNLYAPIVSPAFTGTPTAPTATAGTNTTQIATMEALQTAVGVQNYSVVVANATTSTIATLDTNATYIGHITYASDQTRFRSIVIGIGQQGGAKQGTIASVNDSAGGQFTVSISGDVVSVTNSSGSSQTFKMTLNKIKLN